MAPPSLTHTLLALAALCLATAPAAAATARTHPQASLPAPPSESCASNPSQASCVDFELPPANVTAALESLCGSMSNMPGCSLRRSCQTSPSLHSKWFCRDFSLLADICASDMPRMKGCSTYTQMCRSDTVVRQCFTNPPLPFLPTTKRAKQLVNDICGEMDMAGCEKCAGGGMCPGFDVYGQLCLAMPGMSQCQEWKQLCHAEPSLPVCPQTDGEGDGGNNGDDRHAPRGPTMKMFFHFGYRDYVLVESWVPQTAGSYAIACAFCFVLAVAYEALLALGAHLESQWTPSVAVSAAGLPGSISNSGIGGAAASAGRVSGSGPSASGLGGNGSLPTEPDAPLLGHAFAQGALPSQTLGPADGASRRKKLGVATPGHGSTSVSPVPPPPGHETGIELGTDGYGSDGQASWESGRNQSPGASARPAPWCMSRLLSFFTKPVWTPTEIRIWRAVLRLVTVTGAYLCMLLAMSFNVGLFASVVLGLAFGSFLWGDVVATSGSHGHTVEKEHCC
ncbi:Ctr copper transporter family-domain-containing protein [Entophlyctis helioformis]|nr:Ctr copper transporter family-domain-containing protein [Entophlyctis helioformis]